MKVWMGVTEPPAVTTHYSMKGPAMKEHQNKFEDETENGPYQVKDIPTLISDIAEFVENSNLSEKGKSVRLGQLTSKLLKCQNSVWSGLGMVDRKFSHCEIFIHRSGEVLNVLPMIVDSEGDSYDLEEASGKVDFMIPVAEIMRRAEAYRDNQDF